jgi:hypothetical protein
MESIIIRGAKRSKPIGDILQRIGDILLDAAAIVAA